MASPVDTTGEGSDPLFESTFARSLFPKIILSLPDLKVLRVNGAFSNNTGYGESELVGTILESHPLLVNKEDFDFFVAHCDEPYPKTSPRVFRLLNKNKGMHYFAGWAQRIFYRGVEAMLLEMRAAQPFSKRAASHVPGRFCGEGGHYHQLTHPEQFCLKGTPVWFEEQGIIHPEVGPDFDPDRLGREIPVRLQSITHPDDWIFVAKDLQEAVEGRARHHHLEFRMKSPAGWSWFYAYFEYFFEEEAKLLGGYVMLHDITSWKKRELKHESHLMQMKKMEAIGMMTGGIAHDFNNVLAAIMGYAQIVQAQLPEEGRCRAGLEEIVKAATRAKNLTDQLRRFSRKGDTRLEPVDLSHLAKETADLIQAALPSGVSLHLQAEPGIRVMGNASQINQLVANLCINAGQAVEEAGRAGQVGVRLRTMDGAAVRAAYPGISIEGDAFACLEVEDNGCGMDPEVQARMFDPFFTTKPESKGTGLGLSIVRGILKSHGASIRVRSRVGEGTTVTVLMVLCQSPGVSQSGDRVGPLEATESQSLRGQERILFVDDEMSLTNLAVVMLGGLGYHVTPEFNAFDALETFKSRPDHFDLVLTDLTMPRKDGLELAAEIRKIRSDMPVILYTGDVSAENAEKVFQAGVSHVLLKPCGQQEMAAVVRTVLDRGGRREWQI
jgi:signal transduction histidine kinase/ActR/RegA family two-component response regulator